MADVTVDWFEGAREPLAELFALAGDSPTAVSAYRDLGRVLVASDGATIVGHLQLVDGEHEAEVKSLAVREERQGLGIGRMLIARAVEVCREERRATLLVATAAADTRVLRFYQRLGFRLLRVERDAFTPEAGYPDVDVDGIALRDRVWLSLDLFRQAPSRTMQLRVARHTQRLDAVVRFYRDGVGLVEVGRFHDHDGYDGVFLAVPGTGAHLELTTGGGHGAPTPHPESLLVLYLGDEDAVRTVAARLGVEAVLPANPYWAARSVTLEDPDGFRVVLVPEHLGLRRCVGYGGCEPFGRAGSRSPTSASATGHRSCSCMEPARMAACGEPSWPPWRTSSQSWPGTSREPAVRRRCPRDSTWRTTRTASRR
jgi:GNAT superfamily N-acetyltransferase/catechol 2,3-dioxygenase-like lactoylglutathione lyase family enzyme